MWRRYGRFWIFCLLLCWGFLGLAYGGDLDRDKALLAEIEAWEKTLTELKTELESLANLNRMLQAELALSKTDLTELKTSLAKEKALSSELQENLKNLKADWIELNISYEKEKEKVKILSWVLLGVGSLAGVWILGSLAF